MLRYLGAGPGGDTGGAAETVRRCARNFRPPPGPRRSGAFDLKGTTLEGTNLALTGQDIQRHLTDCHQCVLMAATLGADVEQLLMHVQVSDMARALILDSCASAAVENLCDNLEADLRTQVEAGDAISPTGSAPVTATCPWPSRATSAPCWTPSAGLA